jgi:hypothetical protein
MTNVRRGMFAALALVLSGLPTAAFAEVKPSAALRSACMTDAIKLCNAMHTPMDQIVACLVAKKSQTSPRCQAAYDAEMKTAAKK